MKPPRRDHRDFTAELAQFQAGEPTLKTWWLERPRYRHEHPSPPISHGLKESWIAVGGFSTPSKMPGTSYCLPAGVSCENGRRLALMASVTGTPNVCASCYAMQGRYVYADVKVASYRRLAALISRPEPWFHGMVALLGDYSAKVAPEYRYHRWHDAGDIVSVEHLNLLVMIAQAVPTMAFWLPTQQPNFLSRYQAAGGIFPGNFTPRLSASRVDRRLPSWISSMVCSGEVPDGVRSCPAPTQGGKCANCRSCWSRDVQVVGYHQHGFPLKAPRIPEIPPYYQDMAAKLRANLPSYLLGSFERKVAI